MKTSFVGSLVSNGLLRVPITFGYEYDLKFISYYDKMRFELTPKPLVRDIRSPQAICVPRTMLRGLFPDYAVVSFTDNGRSGKLDTRTVIVRFVYNKEKGVYVCELPRSYEFYTKYRTVVSLKKDTEKGYE